VREVSDRTRQHVVDVLRRRSVQDNRARAYAEAERAIVVTDRRTEHSTQLAGKAIMRKLETVGDWVTRSELRRSLASKDRGYFEDALEALIAAGQGKSGGCRANRAAPNTASANRGGRGGAFPPLPKTRTEAVRQESLTNKETHHIVSSP